jgi:hypothetical protein
MITQVSIGSIEEIAREVEKKNLACQTLSKLLNGETTTQKVTDLYFKIITRKVSESIDTVIVDCQSNSVKAITFYGSLDIRPIEVFEFFKDYREHYSIHDDLYFYYFSAGKNGGKYVVSFFEASGNKIDPRKGNEKLGNLTISW